MNLLRKLDLQRTYSVNGMKFHVPKGCLTPLDRWCLERQTYEIDEMKAALHTFDFDKPILEAGGGLGVVSCFLNKHLKNRHNHVVYEPHRQAWTTLQLNGIINKAKFSIEDKALCACSDHPQQKPSKRWCPAVSLSRGTMPRTIRIGLQDTIKKHPIYLKPPINLLIDVEGCENELIKAPMDLYGIDAIVVDIDKVPNSNGSHHGTFLRRLQQAGFKHTYYNDQVHGLKRC